jgi:hypothetical protein
VRTAQLQEGSGATTEDLRGKYVEARIVGRLEGDAERECIARFRSTASPSLGWILEAEASAWLTVLRAERRA